MVIRVKGNKPFSVVSESFAISPSEEGYTLMYSVEGSNWTAYPDVIPSGEVLVVNGVSKELFYKLEGNETDVTVKY